MFQHLQRAEILEIADLYLKRVNQQAASMGVSIELSDQVKNILVDKGYDPNLGARPLRRAVQRYIEDPLSEELLLGRFQAGDRILALSEDGETVIFRRVEEETTREPEKELVTNALGRAASGERLMRASPKTACRSLVTAQSSR